MPAAAGPASVSPDSTAGGSRGADDRFRRSPDASPTRRPTDNSKDLGPRVDPAKLFRHQQCAQAIVSGVSSKDRTASRSTLGVGELVARLIPTPDHPTRTFTSALSSVSPAATKRSPKLRAWLTLHSRHCRQAQRSWAALIQLIVEGSR